ncbi:hypothetical protein NDI52_14125 [Leptolyngbya sp. PL-A3]
MKVLEVGNQRLDTTGLIKTTGTMKLAGVPINGGIGESLDPRVNPSRWALGSRVDVQIFNGSEWVPHPRGALRILQNVKPSVFQEDIDIEVGCELAYLDTGENAPWSTRKYWAASLDAIVTYVSGVEVPGNINSKPWRIQGTSLPSLKNVSKSDLINALGEGFDTPLTLIDAIPGQLSYLRRLEGSLIAQMGQVAYSAGYWLWIDGDRLLRATALNLTRLPDLVLSAVHGSLRYEVLVGGERPAQAVVASAPSTKQIFFIHNTWRENRNLTNPEGENEAIDVTGDEEESTVTTQKSLKELFPLASTSSALIDDAETSVENTYDAAGYLIKTVEEGQALKGVILKNLYAYPDAGSTSLFPSSKKITDYEIVDGAVRSIRERFYEPGALVFPSGGTESLVLSRSITRLWTPYKDGWMETTSEIDHKTGQSTCFPRYGPDTTPPEPTMKPEEVEEVEGNEEAEAGFDGEPPRRTLHLQLKAPVNNSDELKAIAEREGAILYGRSYPAQWVIPMPASYLEDYTPFQSYRWEEPAGLLPRYVADSETFVMDANSSTVAAEGLLMGVDTPSGGGYTLAPPYTLLA